MRFAQFCAGHELACRHADACAGTANDTLGCIALNPNACMHETNSNADCVGQKIPSRMRSRGALRCSEPRKKSLANPVRRMRNGLNCKPHDFLSML